MKTDKNERQFQDNALREALRRNVEEREELHLSDDFERKVILCLKKKGQRMKYVNIAAVFLGLLVVCGVTYAAIHFISLRQNATNQQTEQDVYTMEYVNVEADSIVSFNNQQLDNLLIIVAKYYAHEVVFADKDLRELRITTVWNRQLSLAEFLESMNELDGLHFSERGDTIYVERNVIGEGQE